MKQKNEVCVCADRARRITKAMLRRAAPQVGGRRGLSFLVSETMLDLKMRTSRYERWPNDHSDERSRKMYLEQ